MKPSHAVMTIAVIVAFAFLLLSFASPVETCMHEYVIREVHVFGRLYAKVLVVFEDGTILERDADDFERFPEVGDRMLYTTRYNMYGIRINTQWKMIP